MHTWHPIRWQQTLRSWLHDVASGLRELVGPPSAPTPPAYEHVTQQAASQGQESQQPDRRPRQPKNANGTSTVGLALYPRQNQPLPQATTAARKPSSLSNHMPDYAERLEASGLCDTPRKRHRECAASHHAHYKNYGYTSFMFRDAASNGNGNLRDRSLAAAISVALHIAAVAWIWFVGDQAGPGKSETQGHSGGDGMSASFIAADEFRQRIETQPTLASSEAIAIPEESSESVLSAPTEAAIDLQHSTDHADSDASSVQQATTVEDDETAPTESMEAGLNQGGDSAGGSNDDGLRAAYLAALRAAIRQHWNYQGRIQQCNLTIKQSPGGAVQSAVSGECSLAPQDRRALEAAVLMAQPLPYAGYEAVFQELTDFEL